MSTPSAYQIYGEKQAGMEYIVRPSVYAIVQDSNQRIAVVKHKEAFFLPIGGIEINETPVEVLQREIIEETGYQARDIVKRGEAIEYLQGVSEGKYCCIHRTFFMARLNTQNSTSPHPNHQLIWMRLETAIKKSSVPPISGQSSLCKWKPSMQSWKEINFHRDKACSI